MKIQEGSQLRGEEGTFVKWKRIKFQRVLRTIELLFLLETILENQKDNHFITFKTLLPTQCFLLYAIFRATGGFLVKHLGIFS